MENDGLPAPSKSRLKRMAAKQLRKELKRQKIETRAAQPGPDTITPQDLAETTVVIRDGMLHLFFNLFCFLSSYDINLERPLTL